MKTLRALAAGLLLLLAAGPAWAQPKPSDALPEMTGVEDQHEGAAQAVSARIRAMQRQICAITERCRESWPVVRVATLLDARKAMYEDIATMVRRLEDRALTPEEKAQAATAIETKLPPGTMGVYLLFSDRLLIMPDGVDRVADRRRLDEKHRVALLDCTLAHELTHALQGRHVPMKRTREALTTQSVLKEAHAVHVSRQVCAPKHPNVDVDSLLDLVLGSELAAMDGSIEGAHLGYTHGARWLTEELEQHGEAHAWTVLNEVPITVDLLVEEARERLPPPWRARGGLTAFIHQEVRSHEADRNWKTSGGAQSLSEMIATLNIQLDPTPTDLEAWRKQRPIARPTPVPQVGYGEIGTEGVGAAYVLSTFRFEHPHDADEVLRIRRRLLEQQQAEAARAGGPFRIERPTRPLRRAAQDTLVLRYGEDARFVEVWARREHVIVVFAAIDLDVPPKIREAWAARVLMDGTAD